LAAFRDGVIAFPPAAYGITSGAHASTGARAVDANIARLNIEFFRKRLGEETDEAKRAMIERLLAEEIVKLESLSGARNTKKSSS
jgi:hypothetical protein